MTLKNFRFPGYIILLIVGIVLGTQIEKVFSGDNLRSSISKFNDVLTYTEKYYVEEVDTQKLVEAAINGMLAELDPHSVYIPAKQMEAVEESFRGDFDGIGIEFQVVNDTITVVSPISGGPSEALGILSGDRIIKIDDISSIGFSNEKVREKLRGEAGTKVKVTIIRPSVKEQLTYTIVRAKIPLYSVDAHFMFDATTGYVSVSRFSETTTEELIDALKDLKKKGMKQLILDLRGNPGGYLSQATQMADLFIEGKKKLVYTIGRRSEFNEEFFASEKTEYEKIPLIIMVNKGSASASEIVAGAVQDWDRGLIVGETSFGKGLVQRQFPLSDNSALRLTISEYFTPSGRLIQRDYKHVKDKDEYYSELSEREEEEGDNINHTVEKDSAHPIYKTNGGRIVYGGGGITPDYIVKSESVTKYTTELLKNNVFYEFVLKYLDQNGKRIEKQFKNDLKAFIHGFNLTETEVNDFKKFAGSKEVKFIEEDFVKDKDYILARLKAQIARNYWKNEGWFTIILSQDNQLIKAYTLFKEAKDLANLK